MAELGAKSAAYRENLGNIDATANTMNTLASTRVPWGLIVLVVVLILIALALVFLGKETIVSLWQNLWKPVTDSKEITDSEQMTGSRATIDTMEAERIADQLYACFGFWGDNEDGIKNIISGLKTAADWELVQRKFGSRRCKKPIYFDGEEDLASMIGRHIGASDKFVMRAKLKEIGVEKINF